MDMSGLVNVFKQAVRTFLPANAAQLQHNFPKLKLDLDHIRAKDIGLDEAYLTDFVINKKSDAPCTYIEVYEDENINMSVFILKPDYTMPLHDHPHMHGLLKMIWGTAKIRSFTEIREASLVDRLVLRLSEESDSNWRDPRFNRSIFTKLVEENLCDEQSECCILTPQESNFHEITSVGGYAAFLDILSPPYSSHSSHSEEENGEVRDCHYFNVNHDFGEKLFHLSEIPPPPGFYCFQGPYTGPDLPRDTT